MFVKPYISFMHLLMVTCFESYFHALVCDYCYYCYCVVVVVIALVIVTAATIVYHYCVFEFFYCIF